MVFNRPDKVLNTSFKERTMANMHKYTVNFHFFNRNIVIYYPICVIFLPMIWANNFGILNSRTPDFLACVCPIIYIMLNRVLQNPLCGDL